LSDEISTILEDTTRRIAESIDGSKEAIRMINERLDIIATHDKKASEASELLKQKSPTRDSAIRRRFRERLHGPTNIRNVKDSEPVIAWWYRKFTAVFLFVTMAILSYIFADFVLDISVMLPFEETWEELIPRNPSEQAKERLETIYETSMDNWRELGYQAKEYWTLFSETVSSWGIQILETFKMSELKKLFNKDSLHDAMVDFGEWLFSALDSFEDIVHNAFISSHRRLCNPDLPVEEQSFLCYGIDTEM